MLLPLANILDTAGEELGSFLPRFVGALILLLVGLLVAKLVGAILRKSLEAADLDKASARLGIEEHLARAGLPPSLSEVLGRTARIALSLVVIFAALSLLGLQFLSESLNAAVLAIPKVLIAAALVLAGLVLGGFARERVERLTFQLDLPVSLGQAAQVIVVAIFAITAAAQIAVSTAILLVLVAIVLAGAMTMVAIAFGLGGQGVARELSAGRHARNVFSRGDEISVAEIRGRVVSVETMATVLITAEGEKVRIPNRLLVEAIVLVHEESEAVSEEDPPTPADA
ncbi:MAG: mechanosensitive ion channel family protein [Solirubrobacterales bacterium]